MSWAVLIILVWFDLKKKFNDQNFQIIMHLASEYYL